jgi:hypothetical protein
MIMLCENFTQIVKLIPSITPIFRASVPKGILGSCLVTVPKTHVPTRLSDLPLMADQYPDPCVQLNTARLNNRLTPDSTFLSLVPGCLLSFSFFTLLRRYL